MAETSEVRSPIHDRDGQDNDDVPADDQHGQPDGQPIRQAQARSVRTTKVVTSSSLSAIGSSHAPSWVCWPDRRADQTVEFYW